MSDTKEGAAAPDAETITLRVREQGGEEMLFKVKKGTKMAKVIICLHGLMWFNMASYPNRCYVIDNRCICWKKRYCYKCFSLHIRWSENSS